MLKGLARAGLSAIDNLVMALGPEPHGSAGGLTSVLFHSLYANREQVAEPLLAPNQNVTVDDFRRFTATMLEAGYQCVSPRQVDAGLPEGGRYLMITFDDGYFNNTLALDVLEEFQVPATFFVSSGHVLRNEGFWWDALNRELARAGATPRVRLVEIGRLKQLASEPIADHLRSRFGPAVLAPRSDLDRPFNEGELRDFARNRWVHLGNHTRDHAILPHCTPEETAAQIRDCQQALQAITGEVPIAIAYPNGNYTQAAIDAARAAGLRIGLTVAPRRNRLPLLADERMTLGRHFFWGGQDVRDQCRRIGSGFMPSHVLKSMRDPQRVH